MQRLPISQDKQDKIYNALAVGMAVEDAFVYAQLSDQEIVALQQSDDAQVYLKSQVKEFEFSLLKDLKEIASKQVRAGREQATTWMLEKMFPRYSNKPMGDIGVINVHLDDSDPADLDTVSIKHAPTLAEQGE